MSLVNRDFWENMIRPCNARHSKIVFKHGAAYNVQQIFVKQLFWGRRRDVTKDKLQVDGD